MPGPYPLHRELAPLTKARSVLCKPLMPIIQQGIRWMFPCRSDAETRVERYRIAGYKGGKISVDVISPKATEGTSLPCLVLYHGGAFVFPASDGHHRIAKAYAAGAGCRVIYADYRLAPVHPFPYPAQDCFSTYQWVLSHARELEIDPERIVMGGDSAGGNLAIAVALMAKDNGLPLPKAQVLIYPVTDRRMNTRSMEMYPDTPVWNSRYNKKMWRFYCGKTDPHPPAYASVMEADSVTGFPPTYLEVAEFDCLRDEGIAFAQRLQQAQVPVQLHEIKQACHGFESVFHSSITRAAMARRLAFLQTFFR